MDKDWVKIYTSTDFYKAELVRQVLVDHDIEAVLMNKQDTSYKFGEVQINVPKQHALQAIEIITQNDL